MKAIKCILAVLIGVVLTMLSSCSPKQKPSSDPEPPEQQQPTGDADKEEPKQPSEPEQPPEKEEDLPVRRPIME